MTTTSLVVRYNSFYTWLNPALPAYSPVPSTRYQEPAKARKSLDSVSLLTHSLTAPHTHNGQT